MSDQILVGALADSHLTERDELDESVALHLETARAMKDAGVELVLHAGDLFDRKSTPLERMAAAEVLNAFRRIAPVVLIRGNHDAPGDLPLFARIRGAYNLHVSEALARMTIETARGVQVNVALVPWLEKAGLLAALSEEEKRTRQGSDESAVDVLSALLLASSMETDRLAARGIPTLGVAHLTVSGARTSSGQVLIGAGPEVPAAALFDSRAAIFALGHIHRAQEWRTDRQVAAYSGSLQRLNLGEPEEKGWTYYVLERDPEAIGGARVLSSASIRVNARRLLLAELDWTTPAAVAALRAGDVENLALWGETENPGGARVRIRYRIRPEDLEAVNRQAIEAYLLDCDARSVRLEAQVVHDARVRAAEIVAAESTWDQIRAFFAARERDLTTEEALAASLRSKLAELEAADLAAHGGIDARP